MTLVKQGETAISEGSEELCSASLASFSGCGTDNLMSIKAKAIISKDGVPLKERILVGWMISELVS